MSKDFLQLTEESIRNTTLLHGDLSAALVSLPSFGWQDAKTMTYIHKARNMLDELHVILQQYVETGNKYQQTLNKLLSLLDEAEVTDCVNDLVTVRRNARRTHQEKEQYRSRLKKVV